MYLQVFMSILTHSNQVIAAPANENDHKSGSFKIQCDNKGCFQVWRRGMTTLTIAIEEKQENEEHDREVLSSNFLQQ